MGHPYLFPKATQNSNSSETAEEEVAKYGDRLAEEATLWIRANKGIRVSQYPTKIVFKDGRTGHNTIKEEDDAYNVIQVDCESSQPSDRGQS